MNSTGQRLNGRILFLKEMFLISDINPIVPSVKASFSS